MTTGTLRSATSLLAFCGLLAGVASAQPGASFETVKIEADKVLPGIWRFPPHERAVILSKLGTITGFAGVGPEKFCRIGRARPGYTLNCLEIAERSPQASLDANGEVHLSWKAVFMVELSGCRWTFQGRLQSTTEMSGHLGMQCDTTSGEKADLLSVTKMVLSEHTADSGGQAAFLKHLLEEMAAGPIREPSAKPYLFSSTPRVKPLPEEAQRQLLVFPTPDELRPLGGISAVVYVGEYTPVVGWLHNPMPMGPVYGDKTQPVYAVEFENGERLCTLRRRADGVLDRFQCI